MYGRQDGDTWYFSHPGCSIDPNPKVLQKLHEIRDLISQQTSAKMKEQGIEAWHKVCSSPQQVRVMGIPFDTRFAHVMVKADYDMKKLADGSDTLNIKGFTSSGDMTLEHAKNDIIAGRSLSKYIASMNRFWFYPGKNIYKEDNEIVLVDQCPVMLMTEGEYLDQKGDIEGTGRVDPIAKKFTDGFTQHYAAIARKRPIYTELENLFRFLAIANILEYKMSFTRSGLNLDFMVNNFQVPEKLVDRTLPGRSHVKRFQHKKEFDDGSSETRRLWLPSCGGVTIELDIATADFIHEKSGNLNKIKNRILNTRPSSKTLSWTGFKLNIQ